MQAEYATVWYLECGERINNSQIGTARNLNYEL